MISDSERREVAARLRYEESADPGCLNTIGEWYLISFLQSINRAVDNGTEYHLRERLADLIDRPKCENAADPYDGGLFVCSKCGERWELACGNLADNHLCFCPRCGAEVVS